MCDNFIERRRYPRIFFAPEDNMSGKLRSGNGSPAEFPVELLNISAGGLAFRSLDQGIRLKEGERLFLTEIKGKMPLEMVDDEIELVVRWTAEIPEFDSFGAGAEFIKISDKMRNSIEDLMRLFS